MNLKLKNIDESKDLTYFRKKTKNKDNVQLDWRRRNALKQKGKSFNKKIFFNFFCFFINAFKLVNTRNIIIQMKYNQN